MEYIFEKIFVPNKHSFITRELQLKKNSARVHSHKNFELNFIISGTGKRIVGNNISSFDKNDLVLMAPNLPHCWEIIGTEDDISPKCIVIHFYEDLITSNFFNNPELEKIVDLLREAELGIYFYGDIIDEVEVILNKLTKMDGLKSYIQLLSIFDLLINCNKKEYLSHITHGNFGFEKDFNQINKVYEYVFQNLQKGVRLEEAASMLNMSPGSFCRYFKKKTNMTFIEYVLNIRIGYASKVIAETDKQITEIGYECGYTSLANFNHYFKKIMRKTPSEYRKIFRT
ncbi:MAG: AraC family transcriptional regulator [Bacteroidales bacterium]|nr:AraC family transcriptional regulator [Bacteroidales bacterium]